MGIKKGSQFEREIAKYLSKWISDGESDSVFWRTDGSGARATVRAKQNKKTPNSYGDLCYIDDMGKKFIEYFLIEIKRGYGGTKGIKNSEIENLYSKYVDEKITSEKFIKAIRKLITKSKGSNQLDILNLIDNPKAKSQIIEWWIKAEKERVLAGREEILLIIKRDGKNPIIIFHGTIYSEPDSNCIRILISGSDGSYYGKPENKDKDKSNRLYSDYLNIMDLDDFFNEFMDIKDWV